MNPQNTEAVLGEALEAQRRGDWPRAIECCERGLAACSGSGRDTLRFVRTVALHGAGRHNEAWEACAELLCDAESYLPSAVELCQQLNFLLGRRTEMDALLEKLHARDPVPRNAILLRMLASVGNRQTGKAMASMAALLKHPAGLEELRLIFEASARTHSEIERGILLVNLLNHLKAFGKRSGRHQASSSLLEARIFVALGDPARAMRSLNETHAPPASGLGGMAGWMAKRMLGKHAADFDAPKIFCIGLSKTGTSSLHEAMLALGIPSAHWTNPVTGALLDMRDFLIFDALSDISVSYQFEQLYYAFPNARFIYTERPLDGWEKSFLRHYQRTGLGDTFAQMEAHLSGQPDKGAALASNVIIRGLYFNAPSPAMAYRAFEKRVQDFFSDKPDRLLTMNIFAGDGWDKLCAFLGRPAPNRPFPHSNDSVY